LDFLSRISGIEASNCAASQLGKGGLLPFFLLLNPGNFYASAALLPLSSIVRKKC